MTKRLPSADEIARLIIASCKETGDDPVDVVAQRWRSYNETGHYVAHSHFRARHYAYLAIVDLFPDVDHRAAARMVGAHHSTSFVSSNTYNVLDRGSRHARPKANWFSFEALDRVKRSLAGLKAAAPSASAPARAPKAEMPPPEASFKKLRDGYAGGLSMHRAPVADAVDMTAELMGDPPPGRSALDQGSRR